MSPPAESPLRALIVDDEPLARLRLRGLLEGLPGLPVHVRGEAGSAAQALAWLKEHGCDLVFLDIQMPGPDGLQLAQSLEALPQRPIVIFVTAHAGHALRAFEIEALDYLTKPVRRERLQAAVERARARLHERQLAATWQSAQAEAAMPEEGEFLTITERGRLIRVPLGEVLYFKAELKYLTVRTAAHSYIMEGSLAELEQRLGERYLRIHRNALVARRALRELGRHPAQLAGDAEGEAGEGWAVRVAPVDEWLSVSRRQVAALREALAGGQVGGGR
ncbi:MAG TPA: LytTR family DNA-binding domain-containing protein [Burkholderiaceae bacterium]|nr:LytTR family DNA-binding domain-containing protein [Burkholderiaceae bacterium]